MRTPDPKANTTTEAYLAYKAGYLQESELKPVLYEPYLHFDAWLAYWAGLVPTYPVKEIGKNLLSTKMVSSTPLKGNPQRNRFVITCEDDRIDWVCNVEEFPTGNGGGIVFEGLKVEKGKTYTLSFSLDSARPMGNVRLANNYDFDSGFQSLYNGNQTTVVGPDLKYTFTANKDWSQLRLYIWSSVAASVSNTGSVINPQLEIGSDKTTYETFSGKPDMLCDEEALVAYLAGVADTYPEEIKDPYDVRIVGYLKHLVSVRWPEPDYPVNNSEFYLSTMKPAFVSSGDPSADIELDDTAEAPFIDLKMYGDTSQTTYSGKNLLSLDFSQTVLPPSDTNTFTIDRDNQRYARFNFPVVLPAGTYTISFDISDNNTVAGVFFNLFNASETSIAGVSNIARGLETYHYSGTFTVEESIKIIRWFITESEVSGSHATLSNVQIEAGSTATAFEPYVGGVPAPNPDYPQPVNVVTGRQVVGVSGKNLFDTDNPIDASSSTTVIGSNSIYLEKPDTRTAMFLMRPRLPAGTYTVSYNVAKGPTNTEGCRSNLSQLNGSGTTIIASSDTYDNAVSYTFTATDEVDRMYFFIAGAQPDGATATVTNIQIERGSTATDFEPYQTPQSYEINLGKNLFDKSNPNVIVGTVEAGGYSASGSNKSFYLKCESNTTYTIQKRNDGDTNRFVVATADTIPVQGTAMTGLIQSNDGSSITITAGDDAKYIVCTFYRITEATLTEQELINSIQVEVGSTATTYAPYFTPIELCKIGDYQDYIYRDADGDWYLHKEIIKISPNGTEEWKTTGTKPDGYFYVYTTSFDSIVKAKVYSGLLSNSFVMHSSDTTTKWLYPSAVFSGAVFSNGDSSGTANLRIMFPDTVASSTDAVETWFSNNDAVFYYPRSASSDIAITNSELISQLDALMEGGSYKGKTYIKVTATDPNLPGLLYVEAGKYD